MDKMKFTIISVNNSIIPLEIHTTEKVKAPSIRSKFLSFDENNTDSIHYIFRAN